ncbi:MAG: hypothetical protein AB1486_23325 [Planctomycetota bacterium]
MILLSVTRASAIIGLALLTTATLTGLPISLHLASEGFEHGSYDCSYCQALTALIAASPHPPLGIAAIGVLPGRCERPPHGPHACRDRYRLPPVRAPPVS